MFGKTEKTVLRMIGGWELNRGSVKRGKRWENAIEALKNKGILMKEPGCSFLKFTDKAFNEMPKIKKALNVNSSPINF